MIEWIFKNDINEISRLEGLIEDLTAKWELNPALSFNLNIVVEELLSNIIFYGFEDSNEHLITVTIKKDTALRITISDDGKAFNPLTKSAEDEINKSIEDRKIGGLGIHFVKQIMDEFRYERKNEKNELYLTKFLT